MRRIIEINGTKCEAEFCDLKEINEFKIGDNLKVLIKEYSDRYTVYPGVIIGFDGFLTLPTIIIAYMDIKYNSADLKFVYLNSKTTDIEICAVDKHDLSFEKDKIISLFADMILKAENNLAEIKSKKEYFLKHFNKYFEVLNENT